MPTRVFRIGRIAGIPVGISPLWLVIVALFTWTLGANYFPEAVHGIAPATAYALGLASTLLLFASILAHEFGHALVARRRGIEVDEIDLWLLGGVSRIRGEAHTPGDELRFAIAGPAVTVVVALCFGVIALLLPASTPAAITALVEYQVLVNVVLFLFNMLPAFPLDGGRVLRSLLWRRSGDLRRATETAARVGRGFGYLLVALGVLELVSGVPEGLWLALIGFFIVTAASQQAMGAQVQAVLSGVPARELMSRPVVSIPARTTVAQAVTDYVLVHRFASYPVVDEQGRAQGLLSLAQIEALSPGERERRKVIDLAERDPDLLIDEQDDVAKLLGRAAFARVGRAVVVDQLGRPIGLLSITDVQRALQTSRLGARESAGAAV